MAERDHYRVLGVPHDAGVGEIHAAYRARAKELHPDHPGGSDSAFQRVGLAYEVLSDPERRRAYDDSIGVGRMRRFARVAPPEAEPLISRRRAEPLADPISVIADAGTVLPSRDALLERWARNFTHRVVPKAERREALAVEIVLSPEDAAAGGSLPLSIPVLASCPRCGGSGHEWLFPCGACDGRGVVEGERLVRFAIPAGTRPDATFEASLAEVGIDNLYLRLRVRVAP